VIKASDCETARQASLVASGDQLERAWRPLRHISRAVMRDELQQVRVPLDELTVDHRPANFTLSW